MYSREQLKKAYYSGCDDLNRYQNPVIKQEAFVKFITELTKDKMREQDAEAMMYDVPSVEQPVALEPVELEILKRLDKLETAMKEPCVGCHVPIPTQPSVEFAPIYLPIQNNAGGDLSFKLVPNQY